MSLTHRASADLAAGLSNLNNNNNINAPVNKPSNINDNAKAKLDHVNNNNGGDVSDHNG